MTNQEILEKSKKLLKLPVNWNDPPKPIVGELYWYLSRMVEIAEKAIEKKEKL